MMRDGLFDRFPMEAVFGAHNWPGMPVGMVGVNPGAMMASSIQNEGWNSAAITITTYRNGMAISTSITRAVCCTRKPNSSAPSTSMMRGHARTSTGIPPIAPKRAAEPSSNVSSSMASMSAPA